MGSTIEERRVTRRDPSTQPQSAEADTPPVETPAPPAPAVAAATSSGRPLTLASARRGELAETAAQTAAWAQLAYCFAGWDSLAFALQSRALQRLAENRPVDPNDSTTWISRENHADAVLRRHQIAETVKVTKLTRSAIDALIVGQQDADAAAGLDWGTLHDPLAALDEPLAAAHKALPIDLVGDPTVWVWADDQRASLAQSLGLGGRLAADLSHWILAHPDTFDRDALRSWRIGSPRWQELASDQLAALPATVERPVGLFIAPAPRDPGAWVLQPCLSLQMLRLVHELGGHVEKTMTAAEIPAAAAGQLAARVNTNVLFPYSVERGEADSAEKLMDALRVVFGEAVPVTLSGDSRDRWGRLRVRRFSGTLTLDVETRRIKGFEVRRLGRAHPKAHQADVWADATSTPMEIGEAVDAAIQRGLPLLLSSEASGVLSGTTRVGRAKGRPGMVCITTSDGVEAATVRVSAAQAVGRLRALRDDDANVVVDAGARQVIRMTVARPLCDDPILLGRQQAATAVMAVGAGVNASQTGTGKTVVTARSIYHRIAAAQRGDGPPFRGLIVAEGRLIGQWRSELVLGAEGRGMPPLLPTAEVHVLHDRAPIAAQVRAFHRGCADRAGVLLVPNSILDRYPGDLAIITWHLLIADEALRYANPATEAHRALSKLRGKAVADCWLLSATPKGKTPEHLDVLVGLAIGDDVMIRERLNTREGGDLLDEMNAHRLRLGFGPHLVRVTGGDMKAWMPDVRPADAIAIEADPALRALLDAIRQGGQDAYEELLRVLATLRTLEKGSDLHKGALKEFAAALGTVIGNVNVYLDASVDPETLKHSNASLAQALCVTPLVDAAISGGGDGVPTLRGVIAQAIAGVAAGEQIIVFAERLRCLHQLAGTLRDRHHIDARVGDGKLTDDEFEDLKRQFVAGQFPVLLLSNIGAVGHNFQNATQLFHLDLPWVIWKLEQRVGRAARPGNVRGYVNTVIAYIRGGAMEHVVKLLSVAGAEHHNILDGYEGVAAADSTVARQLGDITAQVARSKDEEGYGATAARLRVAAAVFGAS